MAPSLAGEAALVLQTTRKTPKTSTAALLFYHSTAEIHWYDW